MSVYEYDAVVIGGGMSGIMASLTLASGGFKTALVSRGDPVCCLSTGCIDVFSRSDKPLDGIRALLPDHPYSLVGEKGIRDSLSEFLKVMDEAGLPYEGDPGRNRQILTPIGTTKNTCLVPRTMAHADMPLTEYLHVISFQGIKDFFPGYITSRYRNSVYSVYDAGVSTTLGIAARFDEASFLDAFISWLRGLEIPHDRVALPAVLGTIDPASVMEKISRAIGRKVFEIPTLPPSLPGQRLFRAMKRVLQNRGVHLYWGKGVTSVERQAHAIEAVTLATTGRAKRVQGRAFVLATGSFVSGGLFAGRESVRESVFDLPVAMPDERKDWFNADFFSGGHSIGRAGVRVDGSFRPVETDLDNLFACGSILAECEVMSLQCGHGLAVATGVAAAKSCAQGLS